MGEKLRVGVIFGGRSGEHEVSLASAASVMEALDKEKYEVVPIGITHAGAWLAGVDPQPAACTARTMEESADHGDGGDRRDDDRRPHHAAGWFRRMRARAAARRRARSTWSSPCCTAPMARTARCKGCWKWPSVPYAGCGVLGSALGMDKEKAKLVLRAAGLPVVDWLIVRRGEFERDTDAVARAHRGRASPIPSSSSRPTWDRASAWARRTTADELRAALATALEYDRKAIVEPGVNCRELECGVLGNDEPIASVVGEVVPSNEFYDYRAKYIDNASRLYIPAPIPRADRGRMRRMAVAAFLALDLCGLARVDFFLDKRQRRSLRQRGQHHARLHPDQHVPQALGGSAASPIPKLLDRLIQLGLERHAEKQRNRTSYTPEA